MIDNRMQNPKRKIATNECRYCKGKRCRHVLNQAFTDESISTMKHINFSCCQQQCQNWPPKRLIESSQFREKSIKNRPNSCAELETLWNATSILHSAKSSLWTKRTRISTVTQKKKRRRIPAMSRWEKVCTHFLCAQRFNQIHYPNLYLDLV